MAIEKEAQRVNSDGTTTGPAKKLTRSKSEKVLTGVAGGIAKYFDMDPMIVRIIFVVSGLFTSGTVLVVYIILALILPEGE